MGILLSKYWQMKVEKAELTDLNMLNQISFKAKKHWGYPDEWMKKWKSELTVSPKYLRENSVFRLTENNTIVGFCAIEEKENEYEIGHLWILPKFMGKGYGKILLDESLKRTCISRKRIIVISDPNAEKFYQKMGFETFAQKESYPIGRYLPVMRRKPFGV